VELISTGALGENKKSTSLRIEARVVNTIREKGQLAARAARLRDEMHLVCIAEARENKHLRFGRMPVEKSGRAALGITPDLFGDLRRDRWHTVEHQAVGWY